LPFLTTEKPPIYDDQTKDNYQTGRPDRPLSVPSTASFDQDGADAMECGFSPLTRCNDKAKTEQSPDKQRDKRKLLFGVNPGQFVW